MINKNKSIFHAMIILIVLLAALIAGCGDKISKSSDVSGTPATGGAYASGTGTDTGNLAECLSCHADAANPAGLKVVVGDSDAAKASGQGWLSGPHGNYESAPNYLGTPYYATWLRETCLVCHDSASDGQTIDDYAESTGRTAVGEVDRPVVGCTACHGSGDEHFGLGDVEFIKPGAERCGLCHNDEFPHVDRHNRPAGDRIYEDYAASPHAHSINDHIANDNGLQAPCSRCHTDEGARLYKDKPYFTLFGQYYEGSDYNNLQCSTCHDAHNPSKLLKEAGTDSYGNAASSVYMTCTNCHMDKGMIHGEDSAYRWSPNNPGPPSAWKAGVGNFDSSEIIYDTHFDWNTTDSIEGYVMDPSKPDVCLECHNVHSADISINEQWARSAHGGHILDIKERAFLNVSNADPDIAIANVKNLLDGTDPYGAQRDDSSDPFYTPAWVHYDFKSFAGGSCLRCKTATGYKALADDPVNFSGFATMKKFYAKGKQKELLYCWACHTSGVGTLRIPGGNMAFANYSPYSAPAARIANVPFTGGSNICFSCHAGRKTGADVKAAYNDGNVGGGNFGSRFSSHYLSAAGTVYRLTGFEFGPSSSYDDYSWFAHGRIGVSIEETGVNGPCVGCHMRSNESHSLEASTRVAGTITDIPPYEQTCSVCHGDKSALVTDMNSLHNGFEAALDVLEAKIEASMPNLIYNSSYPYFYNSVTNAPYTAWDDLEKVGAAFNFSLLHHEEGAYVHNSRYTKRLLFDSIDYLQDNVSPPDGLITSAFMGNTTAYQYLNNGTRP